MLQLHPAVIVQVGRGGRADVGHPVAAGDAVDQLILPESGLQVAVQRVHGLLLVLAVKALVVKAAVLLVLCGLAVIELLIRFRLRGQGSAAAAADLFAAQRALPAAGAGAQFGILIREMPLVPGCMGGAVDAAAQLFVAGTVIGGTAVRADHDVIFQGQRLTAALAGTAIIFRHVFLQ